MKLGLVLAVASLIARPAFAQVDQVSTPPPNLVLPNYNSVPVGPFGGLEGTAYVARVGDPSAAWFNPAGLARETAAQISGSAGVYQRTSVAPRSLPNKGGSIQQLPNLVGFTFSPRARLTLGAAIVTTNAWNQETDTELITGVPGGHERFAYSADSDFERRMLAFGAGYQASGAWRVGGGLAFSIMDLRLVQSTSDRLADATGLKTLLLTSRASGSGIQLRSQAGVQYDTAQWRFGAAVRTPGLTLYRSGGVTLDGTIDSGAASLGASLFDPDAAFEDRLPWEFQTGGAWVHGRIEAEIDLHAYSAIDAYSMISTDQPTLIYADAGGSQPPTVLSRPFRGLTSVSDGVVNVSAGGHVRLLKDRDFRIHAGVASNQSPVAADDNVFKHVDLLNWTLGVSGSLGKFVFAAGLNHQSGHTDDVAFLNLLNGEVVHSAVDVSMAGFIYSLAYQF